MGGQQTFKAPTDVTVEAVAVNERQRVAKGEVLLVLRDRNLQQQLNQARVDVQKSRNTFNRERERIQERQGRRARAQERVQESQSLLDQGFISEDDFRGDQNALEDAESSLRDAEVDLANAELELRNDELQLQTLQAQLADTRIVAPFDAVILNVLVNPGDGVQQEGELLTIGDPTQEMVRLQLLTLDAQRVRPNMPVRVSVIGPNARTFAGRIADVAPQAAAPSANNSGRNDPTTVEARVVLDAPSQTLIPGSDVSVEIILERSRNAIAIPITAVQNGDSPYVWVRGEDGTAQRRSVVLGLQSVEQVEIRSGLAPGDQIIPVLPSGVTLTPGTPLTAPGEAPSP
nr:MULTISPECIES: efflux RND transporter periplasmic adaptor subunit [unclassified Leptolyngbya]